MILESSSFVCCMLPGVYCACQVTPSLQLSEKLANCFVTRKMSCLREILRKKRWKYSNLLYWWTVIFSHRKNNEINLGFLIDKKLDFFFVLLMKCGSRKKKYRNNGTTNIPNTINIFFYWEPYVSQIKYVPIKYNSQNNHKTAKNINSVIKTRSKYILFWTEVMTIAKW